MRFTARPSRAANFGPGSNRTTWVSGQRPREGPQRELASNAAEREISAAFSYEKATPIAIPAAMIKNDSTITIRIVVGATGGAV